MTFVALGLGANKAFSQMPPKKILCGAVLELSKIARGLVLSSVYRTKAMYFEKQADFFNAAVVAKIPAKMTAFDLLCQIHKIEALFGRDRSLEVRNGPRTLDIDIEFFGKEKIFHPALQIPHPRIFERAFVLVPLLEILEKSSDNVKDAFCVKIQELRSALFELKNAKSEVKKIISADDFFRDAKK